jgi:aryl-alcohol dehydrogenase-like predicted oxidoreductase
MTNRQIGSTGVDVFPIALGCMGMSQGYGLRDDSKSIATIKAALDAGVTMIDTATTYGLGHNERLVGRAIAGRRDDVIVASKFGIVRDGSNPARVDGSPRNARAVCERSLKRLGVDHLDLYYLHRVDPEVPVEESVGAMTELVREGKVRLLGMSEATAGDLATAAAVHPIAALQSEWSLWCRDIEHSVIPAARQLGIGLVPYSPLGRGFLAGSAPEPELLGPDDWRRGDERFSGEHRTRNDRTLGSLATLAHAHGMAVAQLAIAWLLAQGDDVVPVIGMSTVEHLDENLAAARIRLDQAVLDHIESQVSHANWSGVSSSFRRANSAALHS